MHLRRGTEKRSFEEILDKYGTCIEDDIFYGTYIEKKLYGRQIGRYLKLFEETQMKILIFDEFCQQTKK